MTEWEGGRPDRRTMVTAALGSVGMAGLGACAGDGGSSETTTTPTTPSSSSGSPSSSSPTSTRRRLTTPKPWTPRPGEVEVWCKRIAVRETIAALTVDDGRPRRDLGAALRPLTRQVEDLEQSVVDVVYPQYGGLTRDRRRASVMIVLDLIGIESSAEDSTRTSMTIDVRLRRRDSWEVTEVIVPESRRHPGRAPNGVRTLLRSRQVDLPREARLDLLSGTVDSRLVEVVASMSEQWRLGVQVFRAGHPEHVFGTRRTSNHTDGRAVDIRSLDGIPVIARDEAPWRAAMEAAIEAGADEVGGPDDLGGPHYFTNDVHQDHLHVAFEG